MVAKSRRGIRTMRMRDGTARAGTDGWLAKLQRMLRRRQARARLRRELPQLGERMLHDMNARRLDLDAEARKPFWSE